MKRKETLPWSKRNLRLMIAVLAMSVGIGAVGYFTMNKVPQGDMWLVLALTCLAVLDGYLIGNLNANKEKK